MTHNKNFGNKTGIFVVAPKFSLIKDNALFLDRITADAFGYADESKRKLLFAMRGMLNRALPDGTKNGLSPREYLDAMEHIREHISSLDIPADTRIIFPGAVEGLPPTEDSLHRICDLGNHITLSLLQNGSYGLSLKLMGYMLDTGAFKGKKLSVITDRPIPAEAAELICKLWKHGGSLTVCSNANAAEILRYNGYSSGSKFDSYEGFLTVQGETLAKLISLDSSLLPPNTETERIYPTIKTFVEEMLEAETKQRFKKSRKGSLYYCTDREHSALFPLALLYSGCIKECDKKINDIFSGGARHDIIAISNGELTSDKYDNAEYISKALCAACTSLENYYPIKAVPVFRDVCHAESISELGGIIRRHVSAAKYAYGGASLTVTVPRDFCFDDPQRLSSYISALFAAGGTAFDLQIKGDGNE